MEMLLWIPVWIGAAILGAYGAHCHIKKHGVESKKNSPD